MPYGNLAVDVVQSSTAGTPPQFNDGNGTQVGTLCRAWVNFNGGTSTIRASFNVSSITRTGSGTYTINFATAMTDANYSWVGIGNYNNFLSQASTPVQNTGSFNVVGIGVNPNQTNDQANCNIAVFR